VSELVKIGAVWKGQTKKGDPMLSGVMGDASLVILPNGFKEKANHPDYIVYVAKREKRDGTGDGQAKLPDSGGNDLGPDDVPF
jgi:uncharacterized protein (DUF736 family)